ncbi:MAG: hypothetical protein ABL961_12160 [Vicinamibacterales bacterium]
MTERPSHNNSTRWLWAGGVSLIGALLGAPMAAPTRLAAQAASDLSGTWTLDRDASQFPREIGFDADFLRIPSGDSSRSGGGRGRRGGDDGSAGGGGGLQPARRPQGESFDDAQRRQRLTDEVRTPPARLTISETPDVVTFSDDSGNVRSVHPNGPAETLSIGGTPVLTVAHREGRKLIVLYSVVDQRQIRYTYAHPEGNALLEVDVEFLERNRPMNTVRRVYKTFVPSATTAVAAIPGGSAPGPAQAAATAPRTAVPRAGSEFTGLKRVGIVVEELSTQAIACGLKRETLEAAAAKPFTDAGLKTSINSDEDTYVHVTVMTSSLPTGMCITRYDWSLYSMADATLSHQRTSLLAQVLLAHKGGLTGSMPAVHGADVIRGVTDGLMQVAGIIRDANK